MKWIEVQIKTTPEAEEAVSNIFYEEGVQGVVIESPNDLLIMKQKNPLQWDFYDEELLEIDPEVSIIKGYMDETTNHEEKINNILDRIKTLPSCGLEPGGCELSVTEVHQEDWANAWKKFYKPVRLGEQFVIKPTWETYHKKVGDLVIEMDPGMAFGSGLHETTQLCVGNLEQYVKAGDVVIDIGCGSGILALAAGKLKCKKVIAVDLDSMAVKVARENVELNDLGSLIEVREGNLLDVVNEEADVVVANILAEVVIHLTDQIKPYLKAGGLFISSGIILDRLDDVTDKLALEGFDVVEVETFNEWASVVARKKKV